MKSFLLLTLLATASTSPLSDHSRCECEDSIHLNISTSPFVNIMNVRIDTPEAIYSTPPVVIIGKNDGDIVRCKVDNPKVCEVILNTGGHVYSLVVSGEYIFAGSYSAGTIHRCDLNKKSCNVFLKNLPSVESLTTARGYVYAGLYNGTILRCQQNDPTSCKPFHNPGSHIYSVIVFNDKIYAGLWEGQLMSCSLRTENNCTLIYTMTAGIMGFSTVASNLFAVTWDGRLWNCSRKSDDVADFCASVSLKYNNPRDLAIFNGDLYTLENDKGVYTCQWANNSECASYGDIKNAVSMAFAYGTYEMQSRFKSEDTTCKWQRESQCPPAVTYYNADQRALMEVHVINGKLYNSLGNLVDTTEADRGSSGPAAIFAMGPDGTILLSNQRKTGLLHTSSFFAGKPVSGAGDIVVKRGVIKKISACSEHYQSDLSLNGQVIQSLRAQGYTDPIISQMCGDDEDLEQTESNSVQ